MPQKSLGRLTTLKKQPYTGSTTRPSSTARTNLLAYMQLQDFNRSRTDGKVLIKASCKHFHQSRVVLCTYLYFVPQFHRLFSAEELPSDSQLIFLLKRFVRIYGLRDVHPNLLTTIRGKYPSFRHEGKGSAYEFILNLLQRADEDVGSYVEMDSVPPGETWEREVARRKLSGCQPLHDIFSVVIEETMSCSVCKNSVSLPRYQRFLSMDLPPHLPWLNRLQNYLPTLGRRDTRISGEECIWKFLNAENHSRRLCQNCGTITMHSLKRSLNIWAQLS